MSQSYRMFQAPYCCRKRIKPTQESNHRPPEAPQPWIPEKQWPWQPGGKSPIDDPVHRAAAAATEVGPGENLHGAVKHQHVIWDPFFVLSPL